MPIYKLSGYDRETGEPRSLIVEKDNERAAIKEAYSEGLVLESVAEIREASVKRQNDQQALAGKSSNSSGKTSSVSWLNITELNWRSAYNRQVSIVAMGVMFGMLLFSCVSSMLIYLLALLGRWAGTGAGRF